MEGTLDCLLAQNGSQNETQLLCINNDKNSNCGGVSDPFAISKGQSRELSLRAKRSNLFGSRSSRCRELAVSRLLRSLRSLAMTGCFWHFFLVVDGMYIRLSFGTEREPK